MFQGILYIYMYTIKLLLIVTANITRGKINLEIKDIIMRCVAYASYTRERTRTRSERRRKRERERERQVQKMGFFFFSIF